MAQFLPALTPAIDGNGNALAGAVWEFYGKGTTTPQALAGGAETATADGAGNFAALTLDTTKNYRAILKSSAGVRLFEVSSDDEAFFDAAVKAAIDTSGAVTSGATWSFYTTGTTTPQTVYADPETTIPLGTVVQANANGVFPQIYLDTSVTYKAVLNVGGTETTLDPVDSNAIGTFLDPEYMQELEPHGDWDGSAGSGFTTTPSDPTRTTAKPACRLLVPPRQTVTDTLTIGVFAAANNAGSLATNLGMDGVTFHLEGNSIQVDSPTIRTFTRPDGSTYDLLGWWVDIKKPTGTEGIANVYVKATPADTGMQSRVIGPYPFLMYDDEFDFDVTVASSGADYTTMTAALTAFKNVAQRGRITVTEAGTWDLGNISGNYAGDGYCTIEASAAVTFAQSAPASEATFQRMRPQYDRLHFKGSNITIDMVQSLEFYTEVDEQYHWFDGINIRQSAGRNDLWRLRPRNIVTQFVRFGAYFTDCDIQDVNDWGDKARLARGNVTSNTWADALQDARCSVCNEFEDHSSFDYYQNVDAVTIRYTGSASTATVTLNGGNMSTRTLRLYEDDVEVATFSIENSSAAFTANTNYTCQNVVDFVNGESDWTATLNDNTRFAAALTFPGSTNGAGFIKLDAKTADLVLPTHFDIHSDIYQLPDLGAPRENVVFAFNQGFQIDAQDIFITGDDEAHDFIFICNAFYNNLGTADADLQSQLDHIHSHVVVAHNTLATQKITLRESLDYVADSYCLTANNSVLDISDAQDDTLDSAGTLQNNHIHAGENDLAGAVGTTIGGDSTSLYADAANGDFTPAGDLLTNTVAPVVPRDLTGALFPNPTEKGAVA